MQRRDKGLVQSLGGPLTTRVKASRVLVVGAGGIGCELLKNLVCCGFGSWNNPQETQRKAEIVVVDLDTIDLSNLNRQFLFRKQHIKKPKAHVAKETASRFNPYVKIDAHHASIFDSKYNVDFFESFDLVFNALDNLAARRHVNRMCLAADVPLIESGTTGFNGQVQPIKKGVTECYDCNPKPVRKDYPICTIRSTPTEPVHCIVWAKSYLLPELFGASEDQSSDIKVTAEDNADEVAKLKQEAEALRNIRKLMGKSTFAQQVFNKVFHDDIERLWSMVDMWKSRRPPESLRYETLIAEIDSDIVTRGKSLAVKDQSTWTLHDNLAVFAYSLDALSTRAQTGEDVIEFDKDDKDVLDFVAAAANLRSHVFNIPKLSEWEIKKIAGNIVPAIATSNALTASLCVLAAFKIIRSQSFGEPKAPLHQGENNHAPLYTGQNVFGAHKQVLGGNKMVFLNSRSTDHIITTQNFAPPNPACAVCSPVYAKLLMPSSEALPNLQELVDLLDAKLRYEEFSICTDKGIIYDPDLEDNLPKSLAELGIDLRSNSLLTVMDGSDQPRVDLVLSASAQGADLADGEINGAALSLVPNKPQLPLKPSKAPEPAEVFDTTVVPNGDHAARKGGRGNDDSVKRKRKAEDDRTEERVKRLKQDDVFLIGANEPITLSD